MGPHMKPPTGTPMMLCSVLSSGLWTQYFFCLNVFSSHQCPELCKIVFWAFLEGFWGYSTVCSAIQVRTPLWRSGCSLLGWARLLFTTYSGLGMLLSGSHILSCIMLIMLLEEDAERKPRLGMWATCPRTQNLWMPESESDPVSGLKVSLHGLVWCYKCLFICPPLSLDLQGVEQILCFFCFFSDFFFLYWGIYNIVLVLSVKKSDSVKRVCVCVCRVCVLLLVMSNSLRPYGLWPAGLLCPWDFPGKSNGVSSHFLLQGIFPTQGSNPCLLHWQANCLPLSHLRSSCVCIHTCVYVYMYTHSHTYIFFSFSDSFPL